MLATSAVIPLHVAYGSDDPTYLLPAPAGTQLQVSQGNEGPEGRIASDRYAFDFVAAGDTEPRFAVLATRGGTVLAQRSNVRGGRCNDPLDGPRPDCWSDVNYVLIDHGDGTSGLYMHLKRNEPLLRRGQVVSAGQAIGFAGSSGWTDEIGVRFQVQETPTWDQRGSPGWFQTTSLPAAFADPSVIELRADGVPLSGDIVTSSNPGPARGPFRPRRRPLGLPASVPLMPGGALVIGRAYGADDPDGYGLHLAPAADASEGVDEGAIADPGTAVRPLFGGELVYAGCAGGDSSSLGHVVIVRRTVGDDDYLSVVGHLSDIEPHLLSVPDPESSLRVAADEVVGHVGGIAGPDDAPATTCPGEGDDRDLFAGILRDASVTEDGEILGGVPVSPEPLVGLGAYEGLAGWSGPIEASDVDPGPGRPRANWTRRTPAHGSHIAYGDPVRLSARVRDVADIAEVRFRLYYPAWPRSRSSHEFAAFDPTRLWRLAAVCRPPGSDGEPRQTRDCSWDGDARDAVVTFDWEPDFNELAPAAAWLPRARPAIGHDTSKCVPVSLAVEVIDRAGHVRSGIDRLPLPRRCDAAAIDRASPGRVVYLDPFVPPRAPAPRGRARDRIWPPPGGNDPLGGAIVWRDRSNNEDGFHIYARRSWLQVDCSVTNGRWRLIDTIGANRTQYRPRHGNVVRTIPVPDIQGVPGSMRRWEYAVSAYNEAGVSQIVPVGGFVGPETFCGLGQVPPDDL